MTDYQKSKRRSDSTPAEKQMVADALARETDLKRIRILEEKVRALEYTVVRIEMDLRKSRTV
jgi:hypothetical protein